MTNNKLLLQLTLLYQVVLSFLYIDFSTSVMLVSFSENSDYLNHLLTEKTLETIHIDTNDHDT